MRNATKALGGRPRTVRGWPDWMPEVEPGEIGAGDFWHQKGGSDDLDSPRCSVGLIRWCFGPHVPDRTKATIVFRRALLETLNELTGREHGSIACANDDATPTQRARAWNKTIARFGYTQA